MAADFSAAAEVRAMQRSPLLREKTSALAPADAADSATQCDERARAIADDSSFRVRVRGTRRSCGTNSTEKDFGCCI